MKRRYRMLGLLVSTTFLVYAWNLSVEVHDLRQKLARLEHATRNYVARDTETQLALIHAIELTLPKRDPLQTLQPAK